MKMMRRVENYAKSSFLVGAAKILKSADQEQNER